MPAAPRPQDGRALGHDRTLGGRTGGHLPSSGRGLGRTCRETWGPGAGGMAMGCGLQAHRLLILVLGDTWGGVELGGGEATLIQGPGRESGSPKLMLCISTLKRFQDLSSLLCTPVFLSRDDSFLKIVLMWDTSQSLRSMGQTTVPVLPTAELWGRWKCLRSRCSLPGDRECATPAPGPARPPVLSPVTGPSACTSPVSHGGFPFSTWSKGTGIRMEIWKMDAGPRAPSCS